MFVSPPTEEHYALVLLSFVSELWLLLVTTDLDLSKPELSALCLASVEAESFIVVGNHPARVPFHIFTDSGS